MLDGKNMDEEKLHETDFQKSEAAGRIAIEYEGWERVGYFGSYHLFARENLRRIVDPDTGKIVAQYILNNKAETGHESPGQKILPI